MARSHRRSPAASSLLAVGAIACLLAVAALPAVVAQCDDQNKIANNDADKVKKWTSACDKNGNQVCKACGIWTNVVKPQHDRYPLDKYVFSKTVVKTGTSKLRAKILPTAALQGIESIADSANHDKHTFDMWETALTAAKNGNMTYQNVDIATHPIAFINSLNERSQHQMHVHVGAPVKGHTIAYDCLHNTGMFKSQPGKYTVGKTDPVCKKLSTWTSPTVTVRGTIASAAGINQAIRDGFQEVAKNKYIPDNLDQVQTAVLVQPHNGNYLVVLITGPRVNDYTIFGDESPKSP